MWLPKRLWIECFTSQTYLLFPKGAFKSKKIFALPPKAIRISDIVKEFKSGTFKLRPMHVIKEGSELSAWATFLIDVPMICWSANKYPFFLLQALGCRGKRRVEGVRTSLLLQNPAPLERGIRYRWDSSWFFIGFTDSTPIRQMDLIGHL